MSACTIACVSKTFHEMQSLLPSRRTSSRPVVQWGFVHGMHNLIMSILTSLGTLVVGFAASHRRAAPGRQREYEAVP